MSRPASAVAEQVAAASRKAFSRRRCFLVGIRTAKSAGEDRADTKSSRSRPKPRSSGVPHQV